MRTAVRNRSEPDDIQPAADMPGDPFHIDSPPGAPLRRAALTAARPFLSWVLGLGTYRTLYRRVQATPDQPFESLALEALNIPLDCSPSDVDVIPRRGPLMVASNHPHGALDGLVLLAMMRRARSDVRLLANHLLARVPELRELCFFVDPFDGPSATARSRSGLRAAHMWLRGGGALVMFPAGEVAHRRLPDGTYADSPWHETVARLALMSGAQVLPAYIEGANSRLFYAAGRLHPAFRTVLLARELLKKRGFAATVRVGRPTAARDLASGPHAAALATQAVRTRVDRLASHGPVEPASDRADAIASEIANLPAESCLVESGALRVFCTEAGQIPATLDQIGRLRERAFRAVGEGTDRELDLDAFDARYLHLFSWDGERRRIVGAYRIGRTDEILATHGVEGLYTRTLFRYDWRLIERLSPALELGRSFVRPEYQRNHNALLLLWRGIGRFVVRNPQYRVLFGPVSISARYSDSSRGMLRSFLEQNHMDRSLAELVQAVNPQLLKPAPSPSTSIVPRTIDEANRLIANLESDGKGMPVLLRQYLKLNARLIGFNVDPDFGSALDALMLVDLTTIDPSVLARYLGREGASQFLAFERGTRHGSAAA
jgi:putative hemolysin